MKFIFYMFSILDLNNIAINYINSIYTISDLDVFSVQELGSVLFQLLVNLFLCFSSFCLGILLLVGIQLFQHLSILFNFVLRFSSFSLDYGLFCWRLGLFLQLFVLLSDFGNFTLDLADMFGEFLNDIALFLGLGTSLDDFLWLIFLVDFGLSSIIIFIQYL